MEKTRSEVKLNWWPTPQDYNEAIQVPQAYLLDPELKTGLVYTDALGLPRPVTGSFASVYRMHCPKKDFALRLFLRNIRGQDERYALISSFVQNDDLPYTVTFDFLKNGIKLRDDWFPALKMEWVEGIPFDDYIIEHLGHPAKMELLISRFLTMMEDLRRAGIAHGDLQHGNIIMWQDELRLVDYDGMFVPAMKGYSANELGHRNYQHPQRAMHHFGPYLDNFSAWVIYTSLRALQIDAHLLHQLGGGDDCLLFRQSDFIDPIHSAAFAALEKHENAELKLLGRFVRAQLKKDLADIPFLKLPVPTIAPTTLEAVSGTAQAVRSGPRLLRGNLPAWLEAENAEVLFGKRSDGINGGISAQNPNIDLSIDSNAIPGAIPGATMNTKSSTAPTSWTVVAKPSQSPDWIKPVASMKTSAHSVAQTQTKTQASQPNANWQASHLPIATIPTALSSSTTPRQIEFNNNCGYTAPTTLQWVMLANPAVWIMLISLLCAFTVDGQVATHAVESHAIVTNVHRQNDGKQTIEFEYTLQGNKFKKAEVISKDQKNYTNGDPVTIYAVPGAPQLTEKPNEERGSKQRADFIRALVCLLINIICQFCIWYPARKYARLARNGIPVVATVHDMQRVSGFFNIYQVQMSYRLHIGHFNETINLSKSEYEKLTVGGTEVILCDPNAPANFVLYEYCRYHPIEPKPQPP